MVRVMSGRWSARLEALRRPWLLALLLVAAVAAAWAWSRTRAVPVQVLTVRAAPLVQSLAVSGRVVSENRVFVGATLTGRVLEVTRREGGTLRAGELLVRLDDAELAAAVRQAEAGLASAEARLVGQRRLAAPVATQQLEQARANAAAAEREVQRTEQLLAQGFVGQARLDEVKRVAEVAQAAQRAAQVQQEANASGSELLQAQTRVAEARAALALARARLAQTRITAPGDATVLARLVEPGQIVQPGTRLAELGVRGPLQLVALVDEKYLARLAVGMVASVVADAFPGRPFEARVASISPLVDVQRGAVEVKLSLPALPAAPVALKNDMTVSIEVVTGRRDRAITVPGEALRPGPAVLVLQDDRAMLRPVRTGLRTLGAVEVVHGLQEGERVVLDAAAVAGTRVRAVERVAGPAAGEGLDVGAAMRGLGRD
jgi:HlyD family secretion protein